MTAFAIDASIAVKWVVEEVGTQQALTLRRLAKLMAPELLVPECADILWKKVQRDELSKAEALLAARLLQAAEVELLPTRSLLEAATRIAIDISTSPWRSIVTASTSRRRALPAQARSERATRASWQDDLVDGRRET